MNECWALGNVWVVSVWAISDRQTEPLKIPEWWVARTNPGGRILKSYPKARGVDCALNERMLLLKGVLEG